MIPRMIDDVIRSLPGRPGFDPLPAPKYSGGIEYPTRVRLALATVSNRDHMTDEAWQLFQALHENGYWLAGNGLGQAADMTDVSKLLEVYNPVTVILQDKREWEGLTAERRRDPADRFHNVGALAARPDVFRGTVLKDSHGNPEYHRQSAEEIGAHFWVTYYHGRLVSHLAPYVRPEHLVRTWHSLDRDLVPRFSADDRKARCLVSGAVSNAYPLRRRLVNAARDRSLWYTDVLPHPGYHQSGCVTPEYLLTLSEYRVAVCTSSRYGYAVRKIMEATACGCAVITDLPSDEVLPHIDGNLHRVHPDAPLDEINDLVKRLITDWSPAWQEKLARAATDWYDYRVLGRKLADDVEALRRTYNGD